NRDQPRRGDQSESSGRPFGGSFSEPFPFWLTSSVARAPGGTALAALCKRRDDGVRRAHPHVRRRIAPVEGRRGSVPPAHLATPPCEIAARRLDAPRLCPSRQLWGPPAV